MQIKIEKMGGRGVGFGRIDGKAVFVPYGVPGDVVKIRVTKEKKSFIQGDITAIISPSPDRIEPPCPYFGSCGGCAHQNMVYQQQCLHKGELVKEIYRKFPPESLKSVVPGEETFGYRNKLQFHCTGPGPGRLTGGFYHLSTHKIVKIGKCLLGSDNMNTLMQSVIRLLNRHKIPPYNRQLGKGIVRDIMIRESRSTGDMQLTLVTARKKFPGLKEFTEEIMKSAPAPVGFYIYHNPNTWEPALTGSEELQGEAPLNCISGGLIEESLMGSTFLLNPLTFFQVNSGQTEKIIRKIKSLLSKEDFNGLIDAYAGVGTLSLPLASFFKEILAVEQVADSVKMAKENALRNKASHFTIRQGDATAVLTELIKEGSVSNYPCLLLDPPRSGLTEELSAVLPAGNFKKIFYLSCDPHTQARDLERITESGKYRLSALIPFDMFPQTFHVECLAVLENNG